ncbi:MAG: hypothetical protein GY868_18670, partial [Deltaproteobacteria bacterium]|nr:hypothetical protein [Deltaproteobacteria bacterium]
HHRPMDLVESNRLPTAVVYLADLICNVRKIGYVPTKKAEAEEIMAILKSIELPKKELNNIVEKLNKLLMNSQNLFRW